MHAETTYDGVVALLSVGLSDYEIARRTGVPRATVRNWRIAATPPARLIRSRLAETWRVNDEGAYCYLLGVYLGDGTVCCRRGFTPWLQVVNDCLYQQISQEVCRAMEATFPGVRSHAYRWSIRGSVGLTVRHPGILKAFPQHGPGRKHLRRIQLDHWQRDLTHKHPASLLRGLIHSDGCRVKNRFKTKLPSGRVAEYRSRSTSSRICPTTSGASSSNTASCSGSG